MQASFVLEEGEEGEEEATAAAEVQVVKAGSGGLGVVQEAEGDDGSLLDEDATSAGEDEGAKINEKR